ncbi:MAG TPA: TIM barrel protein, partial [bacterium]|nr:TIM barrel protein [bacterium]
PDRRAASVKLMKETVETAADLGAEYVVAHIQRPENFGGDNPSGFTPEKAVDSAKKSLDELLRFADRVEMPVLIENIFRNKSFFSADHYLSLLNEFPRCGFCLDVGHLDVDAHELDFSFDDFLDSLLPWIKAVHLQNSNSGNPAAGARPWKVPVHPSQSPRDGWHDIASMLEKILSANPNCVINFESRINIPEEEEMLREGIEWVKELIPRITPKTSVLSD